MGTILSFEDLEVWQVARSVRKHLYALAVKLPSDERYNLAAQIRSAAVSLTANLAEGFGRFHYRENVQFCRIARASAFELLDHLITCTDQEYVSSQECQAIREEILCFLRLVNGYMRSTERFIVHDRSRKGFR